MLAIRTRALAQTERTVLKADPESFLYPNYIRELQRRSKTVTLSRTNSLLRPYCIVLALGNCLAYFTLRSGKIPTIIPGLHGIGIMLRSLFSFLCQLKGFRVLGLVFGLKKELALGSAILCIFQRFFHFGIWIMCVTNRRTGNLSLYKSVAFAVDRTSVQNSHGEWRSRSLTDGSRLERAF